MLLAFLDHSKEALDKLDALGDKLHALSYLRQATNVPYFLPRLVMLFATLDALAGERSRHGKRRFTDMEFIKTKILKDDELYDWLYKSSPRLRHALIHGHKIDFSKEAHQGIADRALAQSDRFSERGRSLELQFLQA